MDSSWNPWKMTAIGMVLVIVTALVTTVVVANWTGRAADPPALGSASPAMPATAPPPAPTAVQVQPGPVAPAEPKPQMSLQAAAEACNRYAANQTSGKSKTAEVVTDGAIGGAIGAAVGAASGAIAGGGKGAGTGAAVGGLVGVGGGVLYGLNENRKNDERYRTAYAGCMRSRGYAG
jgi:hypothetical protein